MHACMHIYMTSLTSITGILAVDRLDPLIRAVDVFGFHMAVMDVRQNSKVREEKGHSFFCLRKKRFH